MSSDSLPHYFTNILYAIIILLAIVNALVTQSKRALDYADRNEIKDMLEDDPENTKLLTIIDFQNKPSKYHYADHIMTLLIVVVSFGLLNAIMYIKGFTDIWRYLLINLAFLILFTAVADVFPKKLAAQNSEKIAISKIGFQHFVYIITLPIVWICRSIANILLLVDGKSTDVDDKFFSENQVMSMLDKGQESGEIKEEGRRMIDSIFEFDDLLAYEIMTPRTDVFMIDIEDDMSDYIDELTEMTHSRIPVCRGDADSIIGLLHIKDFLLQAANLGFENVDIESLLRPAYFVPETKNIDSLFYELQKEKHHIAMLIDEYGGFSGIVSIEDIIEQIFGDIDDEFDEEDRVITKIDEKTFVVDGNVYLDDLDEETGVELESENSETIGGFIIDLMGEIPKEDVKYDPICFEDYEFTILSTRDRRIEQVKIVVKGENSPNNEEEGA